MQTPPKTGIDVPVVALVAVLLAIVVAYAVPRVVVPRPAAADPWLDLAEMWHSPVVRETAIETFRTRWLTRPVSPGNRLDLLVLALATVVAVRAWWRLPPAASRLRRMAPALVPALAVAPLVALRLYGVGASLAALKAQGLMNPTAVGWAIGGFAIDLSWALFVAGTCAIVFTVLRPPGTPAPAGEPTAARTSAARPGL